MAWMKVRVSGWDLTDGYRENSVALDTKILLTHRYSIVDSCYQASDSLTLCGNNFETFPSIHRVPHLLLVVVDTEWICEHLCFLPRDVSARPPATRKGEQRWLIHRMDRLPPLVLSLLSRLDALGIFLLELSNGVAHKVNLAFDDRRAVAESGWRLRGVDHEGVRKAGDSQAQI